MRVFQVVANSRRSRVQLLEDGCEVLKARIGKLIPFQVFSISGLLNFVFWRLHNDKIDRCPPARGRLSWWRPPGSRWPASCSTSGTGEFEIWGYWNWYLRHWKNITMTSLLFNVGNQNLRCDDEKTTTYCNKYFTDSKRIEPGASRRASPDQLCLSHFLRDRIGQSKIFSHDYFSPTRTFCR